jgi:hypothetical protein
MIAEFVRSVEGIQTVGVVALLLSFGAFCAIVVRVWRTDSAHLDAMSRLPLDDPDATHPETRG